MREDIHGRTLEFVGNLSDVGEGKECLAIPICITVIPAQAGISSILLGGDFHEIPDRVGDDGGANRVI